MAVIGRCVLWVQQGVGAFFEYNTPKIVHIRSKKIGILSRSVQACVIAYVVGYVMVYNKGYQEVDKVVSAVTVKGNAFTNFTNDELENVRPEWKDLY
jgi:P2X purinoceptor 4